MSPPIFSIVGLAGCIMPRVSAPSRPFLFVLLHLKRSGHLEGVACRLTSALHSELHLFVSCSKHILILSVISVWNVVYEYTLYVLSLNSDVDMIYLCPWHATNGSNVTCDKWPWSGPRFFIINLNVRQKTCPEQTCMHFKRWCQQERILHVARVAPELERIEAARSAAQRF